MTGKLGRRVRDKEPQSESHPDKLGRGETGICWQQRQSLHPDTTKKRFLWHPVYEIPWQGMLSPVFLTSFLFYSSSFFPHSSFLLPTLKHGDRETQLKYYGLTAL